MGDIKERAINQIESVWKEDDDESEFENFMLVEGNIKSHIDFALQERERLIDELKKMNDQFYESIPVGKVDSFELIKVIKSHYEETDKLIKSYKVK